MYTVDSKLLKNNFFGTEYYLTKLPFEKLEDPKRTLWLISEYVKLSSGLKLASFDKTNKTQSLDDLINYLLGSGASPMTIMLATQIYENGEQAASLLKDIQGMSKWRDAIQTRIDELREIQNFIQKEFSKDETIDKEEFVKKFGNFLNDHSEIVKKYPELKDYPKTDNISEKQIDFWWDKLGKSILAKKEFAIDSKTKEITPNSNGSILSGESICWQDLDAAIEYQRGDMQKLDSLKEITTMQLQEVVQSKQRLTTLASNIADAAHRSQEAVVKNIRS